MRTLSQETALFPYCLNVSLEEEHEVLQRLNSAGC